MAKKKWKNAQNEVVLELDEDKKVASFGGNEDDTVIKTEDEDWTKEQD